MPPETDETRIPSRDEDGHLLFEPSPLIVRPHRRGDEASPGHRPRDRRAAVINSMVFSQRSRQGLLSSLLLNGSITPLNNLKLLTHSL